MKIAVFCENILGASGGAEVYALILAEILSEYNDVTVFTVKNKNTSIDIDYVFEKYNIKKLPCVAIWLKHTKIIPIEIFNRICFWIKLKKNIEKKYDCFINCTHNRLLGFKSIYSIHLIHFPLKNYVKILPFIIGKILYKKYVNSYKLFISNSNFTKYHLLKEWNCKSIVLYPPISMRIIEETELDKKENYILMVGRILPDKCLMEMVDFFYKNKDIKLLKEYSLVIAGNKDPAFVSYFNKLKSFERCERIKILTDLKYHQLVELYKKSKIFLHAKGFNVRDDEPIKMEHFGMTTVEAMANGCIPVVVNKGGQKEIVQNGINGFLWNTEEEILKILEMIYKNDLFKFQIAAIERSKFFLKNEFRKNVLNIYQVYIYKRDALK